VQHVRAFLKTEFQQWLDVLSTTVPAPKRLTIFHANFSFELQAAFKTLAIELGSWKELFNRCIKYDELCFGLADAIQWKLMHSLLSLASILVGSLVLPN
jgi:hypothetical protein